MPFYIGTTRIYGVSIVSQLSQLQYSIQRQLGDGVSESTSSILSVKQNSSVELKFTVESGYLFDTAVATNCEYVWNSSKGTLKISNPKSTVNVSVTSLKRLSSPTNLSISNGTLKFDEVANATNYTIYDNGTTVLDTI